MHNLRAYLGKEIIENRKAIQREISLFETKKQTYRSIPLNQELIMILRNSGNEKLMMIGFPFPLESYALKGFKSKKDTLVFIFLRGTVVRNYQRKVFLDGMKSVKPVKFVEIKSITEFREIVRNLTKRYKLADYYDPYSFLGDSFIGLHFIENFIQTQQLKLNTIYSENYKHLAIVSNTKGYIGDVETKKDIINIFADLIDTQWNRTKYLVKSLAKQNLPSIICGRNIVVIPQKDRIDVYHFSKDDVLLKSENIEDYMNKCLYPFLEPVSSNFKLHIGKSNNIIINPFGSESSKTIPEELILKLAQHLKIEYPGSKILLIDGFRNAYAHLLWNSKLKGLLSENHLENVLFKNYGAFEEIKKDISRYKCALGLTADTSTAHLFNFLGLRNITFFNLERCDLMSAQSLSSDSPLGFCRYGPTQYPALLNYRESDKFMRGVMMAIDYFFGKNHNLDWCNIIFDEKVLLSKIGKSYPDLVIANKKISPRYKLND